MSQDGGIDLLDAPVGSTEHMAERVKSKLDQCNEAFCLIESAPDARIRFHLFRKTGSVCSVHHLFRHPPRNCAPLCPAFRQNAAPNLLPLQQSSALPKRRGSSLPPASPGGLWLHLVAPLLKQRTPSASLIPPPSGSTTRRTPPFRYIGSWPAQRLKSLPCTYLPNSNLVAFPLTPQTSASSSHMPS